MQIINFAKSTSYVRRRVLCFSVLFVTFVLKKIDVGKICFIFKIKSQTCYDKTMKLEMDNLKKNTFLFRN